MPQTTSVGLVLGAGGAFGWAWHLGVLDAVEQRFGFSAHQADAVVGTSAGAAIAISALSTASNHEILATITERPSEAQMAVMRERMDQAKRPWRWLRPMAPRLLRSPGPGAGAVAWVGLLPPGLFPTAPLRRFPVPATWPEQLSVVAVDLDRGERVVWTASDGIDLRDALEASAAVPAMFEPKIIDGVRYIDGAVASATNAELLVERRLHCVVISSPMTRPGRGLVRRRATRQLQDEVAALTAAGTKVAVVEPDQEMVDLAAGFPRTNHDAGPTIVARARDFTLDSLHRIGM